MFKRSKSNISSRHSSESGRLEQDSQQGDLQDNNENGQNQDQTGSQASRPPSRQNSRQSNGQQSRPPSRTSRRASRATRRQRSKASSRHGSNQRSRPGSQDSMVSDFSWHESHQDTSMGDHSRNNLEKRPTLEQIKKINYMENHPMGHIFTQVIRTTNEAAVQGQFSAGPKKNINPKTVDVYEVAELFSSLHGLEEDKLQEVNSCIRSVRAEMADLKHELR